jgi:hypothetical protein
VLHEAADQGKRQESVSNRVAERRFSMGALTIEVNPLPIFNCLGEMVDPLLRNNQSFAHTNFFSEVLLQRIECFNGENGHRASRYENCIRT